MLMIRLQRVGRRKDPAFRVVVTQKTQGAGRQYIEMLGSYAPKSGVIELQADRIKEWIGKGAQPSATVHNILISKNVIEGKKINVLPKKTVAQKEAAAEETPATKVETPKEEAPKEEAASEEKAAE